MKPGKLETTSHQALTTKENRNAGRTTTNTLHAIGALADMSTYAATVAVNTHNITAKQKDQLSNLNQPLSNHFVPLPDEPTTPVNIDNLRTLLINHPNRQAVDFVLAGLNEGFSLGCKKVILPARPKNLKSAFIYTEKITETLRKELQNKRIAGPFNTPPIQHLHCSPIGARLKPDNSARLILDLSQPRNNSINEGITKEDYRVYYEPFDNATDLVKQFGTGCLLSKVDIKSAFRLLPVKPCEWRLLGMHWMGEYFVDCHLPFGCRSSPFIFSVFSDLIAWILTHIAKVENHTHYLDDYCLVEINDPGKAKEALNRLIDIFNFLEVPIAWDKLVTPTTVLIYLGIEIDTDNMRIRLPDDKLADLKETLPKWRYRKKCKKVELLSLIGTLSFATKVIRPGRTFLRRLIDLSTTVTELHHHIDFTAEARKDIEWWMMFLVPWNGSSLILDRFSTRNAALKLFTDASDFGYGVYHANRWTAQPWPENIKNALYEFNIDVREMLAIHIAIYMYAKEFTGKKIIIFSDNKPIVDAWEKGTTPSPHIMTLIRTTLMTAAINEFTLSLQHIPGVVNKEADLLSRLEIKKFLQLTGLKVEHEKVPSENVWTWQNSPF